MKYTHVFKSTGFYGNTMKCTQKLSGAITKQFEALPWIPENTSASFQNSNGTFNNLNDYFLYSPFF